MRNRRNAFCTRPGPAHKIITRQEGLFDPEQFTGRYDDATYSALKPLPQNSHLYADEQPSVMFSPAPIGHSPILRKSWMFSTLVAAGGGTAVAPMAIFKNSSPPVMTPEWSAKCWDFLQHWQSIRDGKLIPATEAMLDTMPPRFVSTVYIVELTNRASIVRFQGYDLLAQWGVDLVGKDICNHQPPRVQAQIFAINAVITGHPCGYMSQSTYMTSRQRSVDVSIVRLPLAVHPGRAPRIIACVDEARSSTDDEEAWKVYDVLGHAWFDIGAGVPEGSPSPISQ